MQPSAEPRMRRPAGVARCRGPSGSRGWRGSKWFHVVGLGRLLLRSSRSSSWRVPCRPRRGSSCSGKRARAPTPKSTVACTDNGRRHHDLRRDGDRCLRGQVEGARHLDHPLRARLLQPALRHVRHGNRRADRALRRRRLRLRFGDDLGQEPAVDHAGGDRDRADRGPLRRRLMLPKTPPAASSSGANSRATGPLAGTGASSVSMTGSASWRTRARGASGARPSAASSTAFPSHQRSARWVREPSGYG